MEGLGFFHVFLHVSILWKLRKSKEILEQRELRNVKARSIILLHNEELRNKKAEALEEPGFDP